MNRKIFPLFLLLLFLYIVSAPAQVDTQFFKDFINDQVLRPMGKGLDDFDSSTQVQLILFVLYEQTKIPGNNSGEHEEVLAELSNSLQDDFVRLLSLSALSGENFDAREIEASVDKYLKSKDRIENIRRLTGVTPDMVPSFYQYYRQRMALVADRLGDSVNLLSIITSSPGIDVTDRSNVSSSLPVSWRGILDNMASQEEVTALMVGTVVDGFSNAFIRRDEEFLLEATTGEAHQMYVQSLKEDTFWEEVIRSGGMPDKWVIQAGKRIHDREYAVPVWMHSIQGTESTFEFHLQFVQGRWKLAKFVPQDQMTARLDESALRSHNQLMDVMAAFLISLGDREAATARELTVGPMRYKFDQFINSERQRDLTASYVETMQFEYLGSTFDRSESIAVTTLMSERQSQNIVTLRFIMVRRGDGWRIFGTIGDGSIDLFNNVGS